ncbi:MAG: hypothetical protein ACI4N3_04340 [Alphaproteobacteria bacterium]
MYKKFLNSFIIISAISINNPTKAQEIKTIEPQTKKTNPINIQYSDTLAKPTPINVNYSNETSDINDTNTKTTTQSTKEESSFSLKGLQIGAGVGILGGANFQLGYRIPYNSDNFFKNRFGFRMEYNTWNPLKSSIDKYFEKHPIDIDDNEFTAILDGDQFGTLIDFYPFSYTPVLGSFRLSAGYYTGDFSIGASLTKSQNEIFSMQSQTGYEDIFYKVNGTATLTATLDYDVKGPYAGLGFDIGLLFGFKMYFDAGVVFTDKPEIATDIYGTGTLTVCNDSTCTSGTTISIDTTNEEIQKLLNDTKKQYEDELDEIRKGYFPIIKLGFLYRF